MEPHESKLNIPMNLFIPIIPQVNNPSIIEILEHETIFDLYYFNVLFEDINESCWLYEGNIDESDSEMLNSYKQLKGLPPYPVIEIKTEEMEMNTDEFSPVADSTQMEVVNVELFDPTPVSDTEIFNEETPPHNTQGTPTEIVLTPEVEEFSHLSSFKESESTTNIEPENSSPNRLSALQLNLGKHKIPEETSYSIPTKLRKMKEVSVATIDMNNNNDIEQSLPVVSLVENSNVCENFIKSLDLNAMKDKLKIDLTSNNFMKFNSEYEKNAKDERLNKINSESLISNSSGFKRSNDGEVLKLSPSKENQRRNICRNSKSGPKSKRLQTLEQANDKEDEDTIRSQPMDQENEQPVDQENEEVEEQLDNKSTEADLSPSKENQRRNICRNSKSGPKSTMLKRLQTLKPVNDKQVVEVNSSQSMERENKEPEQQINEHSQEQVNNRGTCELVGSSLVEEPNTVYKDVIDEAQQRPVEQINKKPIGSDLVTNKNNIQQSKRVSKTEQPKSLPLQQVVAEILVCLESKELSKKTAEIDNFKKFHEENSITVNENSSLPLVQKNCVEKNQLNPSSDNSGKSKKDSDETKNKLDQAISDTTARSADGEYVPFLECIQQKQKLVQDNLRNTNVRKRLPFAYTIIDSLSDISDVGSDIHEAKIDDVPKKNRRSRTLTTSSANLNKYVKIKKSTKENKLAAICNEKSAESSCLNMNQNSKKSLPFSYSIISCLSDSSDIDDCPEKNIIARLPSTSCVEPDKHVKKTNSNKQLKSKTATCNGTSAGTSCLNTSSKSSLEIVDARKSTRIATLPNDIDYVDRGRGPIKKRNSGNRKSKQSSTSESHPITTSGQQNIEFVDLQMEICGHRNQLWTNLDLPGSGSVIPIHKFNELKSSHKANKTSSQKSKELNQSNLTVSNVNQDQTIVRKGKEEALNNVIQYFKSFILENSRKQSKINNWTKNNSLHENFNSTSSTINIDNDKKLKSSNKTKKDNSLEILPCTSSAIEKDDKLKDSKKDNSLENLPCTSSAIEKDDKLKDSKKDNSLENLPCTSSAIEKDDKLKDSKKDNSLENLPSTCSVLDKDDELRGSKKDNVLENLPSTSSVLDKDEVDKVKCSKNTNKDNSFEVLLSTRSTIDKDEIDKLKSSRDNSFEILSNTSSIPDKDEVEELKNSKTNMKDIKIIPCPNLFLDKDDKLKSSKNTKKDKLSKIVSDKETDQLSLIPISDVQKIDLDNPDLIVANPNDDLSNVLIEVSIMKKRFSLLKSSVQERLSDIPSTDKQWRNSHFCCYCDRTFENVESHWKLVHGQDNSDMKFARRFYRNGTSASSLRQMLPRKSAYKHMLPNKVLKKLVNRMYREYLKFQAIIARQKT